MNSGSAGLFTETSRPSARSQLDWVLVAAALVASLGLVWLVTRQPLVVTGFAGGTLLLAALGRVTAARHKPLAPPDLAEPDWSVTVVAIARPDCAVAVTDRAGRLVCANAAFESWFGTEQAPPRLRVEPASQELLTSAARTAWRDGLGRAEGIQRSGHEHDEHAGSDWIVEAERAGRGEDFLIWRLTPQAVIDPVAELLRLLDGKLGRLFAAAGFAAAIVDPDGLIRIASAAFCERATGHAQTPMVGQDFVAHLAQDEDDRLYWARDEARIAPVTLYYLPLADPDQTPRVDPATVPSLMLLVDAGTGVGAGAGHGRSRRAAVVRQSGLHARRRP
jgi:two-component system cell cycle sensor histidine kinase/response regulator CckA